MVPQTHIAEKNEKWLSLGFVLTPSIVTFQVTIMFGLNFVSFVTILNFVVLFLL